MLFALGFLLNKHTYVMAKQIKEVTAAISAFSSVSIYSKYATLQLEVAEFA